MQLKRRTQLRKSSRRTVSGWNLFRRDSDKQSMDFAAKISGSILIDLRIAHSVDGAFFLFTFAFCIGIFFFVSIWMPTVWLTKWVDHIQCDVISVYAPKNENWFIAYWNRFLLSTFDVDSTPPQKSNSIHVQSIISLAFLFSPTQPIFTWTISLLFAHRLIINLQRHSYQIDANWIVPMRWYTSERANQLCK